jgi:hypothetical protein
MRLQGRRGLLHGRLTFFCPALSGRKDVAMPKRFPTEFKRDVVTVNRRRRQRALGKLTPVAFEVASTPPPCLEDN